MPAAAPAQRHPAPPAAPLLRSDDVRATIEKASDLAPLHNPPNLMGIDAAKATFASAPHVRAEWIECRVCRHGSAEPPGGSPEGCRQCDSPGSHAPSAPAGLGGLVCGLRFPC